MNNPEDVTKNKYYCNHILQICQQQVDHGNLYLGAVGSLKAEVIEDLKISAVLTVMDKFMFQRKKINQIVQHLNIKEFMWVDIQDEEEAQIQNHFEQCYNFIQNCLKKYNILVHCQAGVSRSATIVISYVMKKLDLPLELANKLVVSKRYVVSPNQGFWNSLKKHQKFLEGAKKNNVNKIKVQQQKEVMPKIKSSPSQFSTQKYPQKFANHIISLHQQNDTQKGNLFLGQFSILKSHFLKDFKVKTILSVVDESYYKKMKIKQIIEKVGIQNHMWINIKDRPEQKISEYFQSSFKFIEEHIQTGNVLVHCQYGISRSVSVVIAYLIKKFKVNYEQALKFVQQKRKHASPNQGFQLNLIQYSSKIIDS